MGAAGADDAAGERSGNAHERLMSLLKSRNATYRLIEHEPEGVTETVSQLSGYDYQQAAKCIIAMIKIGKKVTRYAAVVVPGHRRVDFARLKALYGGTYAGFASTKVAEELAGTSVGTIPPFAFDERVDLVVDPEVLRHLEVFFNAARLDCSVALTTGDYQRIAKPRVEDVATN